MRARSFGRVLCPPPREKVGGVSGGGGGRRASNWLRSEPIGSAPSARLGSPSRGSRHSAGTDDSFSHLAPASRAVRCCAPGYTTFCHHHHHHLLNQQQQHPLSVDLLVELVHWFLISTCVWLATHDQEPIKPTSFFCDFVNIRRPYRGVLQKTNHYFTCCGVQFVRECFYAGAAVRDFFELATSAATYSFSSLLSLCAAGFLNQLCDKP